jgi:hypothetical protein
MAEVFGELEDEQNCHSSLVKSSIGEIHFEREISGLLSILSIFVFGSLLSDEFSVQ